MEVHASHGNRSRLAELAAVWGRKASKPFLVKHGGRRRNSEMSGMEQQQRGEGRSHGSCAEIKEGFRGRMADLDVHDCIGLAMPFDLENDSCWAKGNVGAKAGNMRQPRNSEN